MGLDMYLYAIEPEFVSADKKLADGDFAYQIWYWRKHPNLHGWMENLYRKRGGEKSFNCIKLFLSKEDLERLEQDIINNKLPHTEGFFFGESPDFEETKANDLEAVKYAKDCIDDGFLVYYSSWW